jgi:hypothetical protein
MLPRVQRVTAEIKVGKRNWELTQTEIRILKRANMAVDEEEL